MLDSEPDTVLGPFSSPGAQAASWASVSALLDEAEVCWLSTVRPDGRPHVTPSSAARSPDGVCFTTGGQERKAHSLEHDSRCVLTTGTNPLTGVDVVIESAWYRMGEAVVAGDIGLYRVAPVVGFAFGKLPTSSRTRCTWPSR